jgi:hypothetical protein
MTAKTAPPELARFIDALGHEVTATIAPSGLLVILARTVDVPDGERRGLLDGHPALDREAARVLGEALIGFADGEGT